jgi:hypothetical protein
MRKGMKTCFPLMFGCAVLCAVGAALATLGRRTAASQNVLQTHSGMWVTASPDGVLRLVGNGSKAPPETFTVVPLPSDTVKLLLSRPRPLDTSEAMATRSGCLCSGFSNGHGFGSYCHSWESAYEAPWCYVDDDCIGKHVRGGSFGRKHERCDREVSMDFVDNDLTFREPALLGWIAPNGCNCSGHSNKHGYGASCKAWEEHLAPGQTPWCYTHAACASELKRRGSFGHHVLDCVPNYASAPPPSLLPPPPKRPPPPPPSPSPRPLAKRDRKLRKQAAHEEATTWLLSVAETHGNYFALVSETTGGFVAVHPPPHKEALVAAAREDGLSTASMFAQLPSGHVLALGSRSLLGLCAEAGTSAPLVCTGYREKMRDPHRKLLRSTTEPSALKLKMLPTPVAV